MTIKRLSPSQIALIMKKGRAYNSGSFLFKTKEGCLLNNSETESTTNLMFLGAFVSSKKVFKTAVDRNRSRRKIKEAFIKVIKDLLDKKQNLYIPEFVFLTKKTIIKEDFKNIIKEIEQILVKNYIIKQ